MFGPEFSWDEYFTGTPITTLVPGEYNSRQTPTGSSVYVLNCLFNKFTSGSNGGALYFTSVTYLLIESSSFISCKTSSNQGGAVYFSNSGGQCVFYSVCSNDCCSTYSSGSSYQFAYISVNNGALSKNYFNYSSITRCVNEIKGSQYNLNLYNGKICCPSTNISLNKLDYQPVFWLVPYKESNSVTCSLTYCSFVDNNSTNDNCIAIGTTGAKNEIIFCNILRNTQVVVGSRGTIQSSGNSAFKDSCILENKANCIFYGLSSGIITLSNCTVDSVTYSNSFTIQNTVTKSFIHALNHISTQNCHSGYDSVGSLIAIPPTSKPKEKLIFCYTYKIIQYRANVSDFFTFISLFIITFIQSGNI
jgi:hypothetical protein